MPPHCDTMDGPVVGAARKALEQGQVELVLPYVPSAGEGEVRDAFRQVMEARKAGGAAREVAERYFFETVVRIHRQGEGAPYTGLKPAGLDVGPVIPVAEAAIGKGAPDELAEMLADAVRHEIRARFAELQRLKAQAGQGTDAARKYVQAMLGLEVYSHHLYETMKGGAHEGHHEHTHA